jgi:hypothetical protein
VGAAENAAALLDPVADNAAVTVGASRRQGVNGALEGIEGVFVAVRIGNGECLVVIVSANFARCHGCSSRGL